MQAGVAAGAEGPVLTASTLGQLTLDHSVPRRSSSGSIRVRLHHLFGRMLVGLPASTWLVVDMMVLAAGVCFAFSLFPPPVVSATPHVALWQAGAIFACMLSMSSLIFGLYERDTIMSRSRIVARLALTASAATVMAYAVIYVLMYATVSRRVTGVTMLAYVVTGSCLRLLVWLAIHRVHRGLLVVGPRCLYESFERAQENGDLHEYRLVGYSPTGAEDSGGHRDTADLGPITEQVSKLGQMMVTDIVVGDQAARDPHVMDWMVSCLQRGCRVTNEATFYEKATGQILVDEITPSWFLFADLKVHCDRHATVKRTVDLLIAIVGLSVALPLLPLIALAIKLCDRGPVFYSQDRAGQNGQIFKLYKFRTMRLNAENGKSIWALPDDPRVTRVGRFLRRSRLDELPQLYNVLTGRMSIIGPRPERPEFVAELSEKLPYYAERHLVKPGITGWAQISFRYGSSVEDSKRKLEYDLYYLKNMSMELDMMILFRTLGTFVRGAC